MEVKRKEIIVFVALSVLAQQKPKVECYCFLISRSRLTKNLLLVWSWTLSAYHIHMEKDQKKNKTMKIVVLVLGLILTYLKRLNSTSRPNNRAALLTFSAYSALRVCRATYFSREEEQVRPLGPLALNLGQCESGRA